LGRRFYEFHEKLLGRKASLVEENYRSNAKFFWSLKLRRSNLTVGATMKYTSRILFVSSLSILLGCSSAPKSENEAAPKTSSSETLTMDSVTDRTSLQEMTSASNVLRAVIAQAAQTKGDADPGQDVVGCKISGRQAKAMLDTLGSLLDRKTESEAADYAHDPKVYAKNNGFETCASECQCGGLASVAKRSHGERVSGLDAKIHARFLTKLNAKAALQTPVETLACARKQTWFCSSDLMKYLSVSNPETP
jgi:hypothetical protein